MNFFKTYMYIYNCINEQLSQVVIYNNYITIYLH